MGLSGVFQSAAQCRAVPHAHRHDNAENKHFQLGEETARALLTWGPQAEEGPMQSHGKVVQQQGT